MFVALATLQATSSVMCTRAIVLSAKTKKIQASNSLTLFRSGVVKATKIPKV